jgi:hypothetical protein
MPTTIYDASQITQRRKNKAESDSFIKRIQNPIQPTTGYAPLLGNYDQSIINTVRMGQMANFQQGVNGTTTVDRGCPCEINEVIMPMIDNISSDLFDVVSYEDEINGEEGTATGFGSSSSGSSSDGTSILIPSTIYTISASLPASFNLNTFLSNGLPAVYNQNPLNSCTANALAFLYEFDSLKSGTDFLPSRLLIYFCTRLRVFCNKYPTNNYPNSPNPTAVNTFPTSLDQFPASQTVCNFIAYCNTNPNGAYQDNIGISPIDMYFSFGYGFCDRILWPRIYDLSAFSNLNKLPSTWKTVQKGFSTTVLQSAAQHSNKINYRLQSDLTTLKSALVMGYPIAFGIHFTQSLRLQLFSSQSTFIYDVPSDLINGTTGGHAIAMVGYDDSKQAFLIRNSWGTGWGLQVDGSTHSTQPINGYFWLTYNFIENTSLAEQFYVLSNYNDPNFTPVS